MSQTPRHSVSVAGIVVNNNDRVLAIRRRDNGHWEPPGGVLEIGETFEEGVRREIREETGITVHVDKLTGIYKNMSRAIVALVFRCTPESTNATITNEAREVRWMTLDEVHQTMAPAYAIRVTDAFDNDNSPHTRAHDGVHLIDTLNGTRP